MGAIGGVESWDISQTRNGDQTSLTDPIPKALKIRLGSPEAVSTGGRIRILPEFASGPIAPKKNQHPERALTRKELYNCDELGAFAPPPRN